MKILWARIALRHLSEAREYLELENPEAAIRQIDLIERTVQRISLFPMMGRTGMRAGTREFPVPGTPYILVYRVGEDRLEILAVLHGVRDWKHESES